MIKKAKLMYVEDDIHLSFVTIDNLEIQGYQVVHFEDGATALSAFENDTFDLCILDVMLPNMDGFELAKRIRAQNQQIPIIFLTAKSLKEDKIAGLKLGADDYLTKPFSIEELILKIDIFLKRSSKIEIRPQPEKEIYTVGLKYEFDYKNLTLSCDSENVRLTQKEADLLKLFAQNPNEVIKRDIILTKIWGKDDYFLGRSLDVFISRLRKYLRKDQSIVIENIHGVGFNMQIRNV
ncbi:MAG: response regulator transcription factor [Bacteroidales bacterium]|nr:response regulator transcription factor [Bacteroidales bacterium]